MMGRQQKILKHVSKDGYGIEIGPCHHAIAPKREGYKVHVIDHASRNQLQEKYAGQGLPLENIEEVDFVWNGQPYAELTGKSKFYDWIIASHVIEHTPDLIGFLNDCDSIMKDDAIISLVIPDKRYCFDHFRPVSGLSKIIDSHLTPQKSHTVGTVAEYFLNVVSNDGQIAWEPGFRGDYEPIHTIEEAIQNMSAADDGNEYIDVHAWCFTPHYFRLIIRDLHSLGLIPFKEVDFAPTSGCEFYVTLGRKGEAPRNVSRLDMLRLAASESIPSTVGKVTLANKIIGAKVKSKRYIKKVVRWLKTFN